MTEIVKHSDFNLDELQRMANMLAQSGYFEADRDRTTAIAQMATKILAGRELGYGPFAAVQGIHVIKGKPALSANLMAAAVKAHPRYDYKVRKMENDEVIIEFFESKESIGLSSFTTKDANAAGTQNLGKFARNMLFARAMSNGVRWYCPDVFYGNAVYTPEELGATVDGEGNVTSPAYTVVNKTTGEVTHLETIIEQAPDAVVSADHTITSDGMMPNGKYVNFLDDDTLWADAADIVETLTTPKGAMDWAVNCGYTENQYSAKTRWEAIVREQFDNKFTPAKFKDIAINYVVHYLAKGVMPEAAIAGK